MVKPISPLIFIILSFVSGLCFAQNQAVVDGPLDHIYDSQIQREMAQDHPSGVPTKLAFAILKNYVVAGHCSGQVVVQTKNSSGLAKVTSNTFVTLTGGAAQYFQDAACSTPAPIEILANTNSRAFYFMDSNVETFTVTASATGLTSAQSTAYSTLGATKLGFANGVLYAVEGRCSSAVTAQSRGSTNQITPVIANTIVNMAGGPATYYSDAACTIPTGSVTIGTEAHNSNPFYFKSSTTGQFTLTLTSAGLTPASQLETVTLPQTKLGFVRPTQTVITQVCSKYQEAQSQDSTGLPAAVTSKTVVSVSGGSAQYYSDALCSVPITSVTIPSGQYNSNSFYFKDLVVEGFLITLSAPGLATGQQNETSEAPPPHYVTLTVGASPSQDVVSYDVNRSNTINGTYTTVCTATPSNLVCVDSNVTPGATYYYEATALDGNTPPDISAPTSPIQVVIPFP